MYKKIQQLSPEWWALKVAKVSGTRWGQLTSSRDNMLIEELADEAMNGFIQRDDFVSDDMQFGIDNESIAIDKYEQMTGMKFQRGGVIISDAHPDIHIASPDGYNDDNPAHKIVLEVKCTAHGKTHLKRFRHGIDSKYMGQVENYFAVDPAVQEVRWISYCPFRPERAIVEVIVTRETIAEYKELKTKTVIKTIQDNVNEGLKKIEALDEQVQELINNFRKIEF